MFKWKALVGFARQGNLEGSSERGMMVDFGDILRELLRDLLAALTRRTVVCFLIGVIFLAGVGWVLDPEVDRAMQGEGKGVLKTLAEGLSYWGDFLPGTLPLCLAIGVSGVLARRVVWRRAAVACLIAAVVSGGLVSAVRLTTGRTRPEATLEEARSRLGYDPIPIVSLGRLLPDGQLIDGFYGIQRPAMFQAFPSGHSATSMATASALVVALPEMGLVCGPIAVGVCWSRLYLHKHHLSDVLVGAAMGIFFGMRAGKWARGERPRSKITK